MVPKHKQSTSSEAEGYHNNCKLQQFTLQFYTLALQNYRTNKTRGCLHLQRKHRSIRTPTQDRINSLVCINNIAVFVSYQCMRYACSLMFFDLSLITPLVFFLCSSSWYCHCSWESLSIGMQGSKSQYPRGAIQLNPPNYTTPWYGFQLVYLRVV